MPAQIDIKEIHWLLDIVQCIDVGVVVVDRQYRVEVWNSFMENHSGLGPDEVHGKPLFELFAEIDETWLRRKVDSVVQLGTRAFSLWEQRPYLMRFDNYQPITGEEAFMYQNVTLLPLGAPTARWTTCASSSTTSPKWPVTSCRRLPCVPARAARPEPDYSQNLWITLWTAGGCRARPQQGPAPALTDHFSYKSETAESPAG